MSGSNPTQIKLSAAIWAFRKRSIKSGFMRGQGIGIIVNQFGAHQAFLKDLQHTVQRMVDSEATHRK